MAVGAAGRGVRPGDGKHDASLPDAVEATGERGGACSFSGDCRALLKSHGDVLAKLDSIEQRLFRDNGAVSIQTRLDRHEQVLRLMLWAVGIIGGTFLVGLAGGMVVVVRELIVRGML